MAVMEAERVEAFDAVHARILRFFPDLVEQLGGDAARLLHMAGIPVDAPSDGGPETTYRQMIELIGLAARELDCADFGMRLARMQSGGKMFGPLGHAMKNSRTFGDALDYVSTHSYAHSLAARVWLERRPADDSVFVGHDILIDRIPDKSQAMEQIMLLGNLAAAELTGGHARVRRVHFRHQPISTPGTYRRHFGCEIRFGQNEDGAVFLTQDLACPVVDSDAVALDKVTAFIDLHYGRQRTPLHAQARGVIMQLLWTGQCTNESVSDALKLHPRTLHRRLRDEGTSFQRIKDEVRRDIMLYYLQQTDMDCMRISEKLGFAEQSVMTRICNRWFAASPTQIRAKGQGSTLS
ncbi:MAG: AraC family transcriptional regulator ligand-binding domain-containing protein [Sphingobium sp.]